MTNFNTATNTEYWIIDEFEFFGQSGLTTRKEVEDAGESTPQEDSNGNVYYVPTRFEDGKAYVGNIQIAHLAEGWEIGDAEEGATPRPFIVAFGGADNAEGGIAEEPIYAIYSSAEDYALAGNSVTETQRTGIWVNFATIYLFHRPVGGYLLSLEEEKQILF